MNSQVCVDASFVVKLGLPEEGSDRVEILWREWRRQGREIVAPPLLRYEITSILCHAVYRRRVTREEGLYILKHLLALPVRLLVPQDLHIKAWQMAIDMGQPAAYDAHYLGLAQSLGCEFWTADKRLLQVASDRMPWVNVVSTSD